MNIGSIKQKNPRYLGLVELFHPRTHGFEFSNYKELLNHYIIFCSKNFLLNEYDCEDEYSSAGEYEYPDDAPYSDTDSDTESETDSETEPNSVTSSNQGSGSGFGSGINITNYAIKNEFEYLKGGRSMCLSAYNAIELNDGRLLKNTVIRNFQNIIKSPKYLQPEIFEKVHVHNRCCAIIKTFWIKIVQRSWKRVFKERTRIRALRRSVKAILYWQAFGKWPDYCAYMPGIRHMVR